MIAEPNRGADLPAIESVTLAQQVAQMVVVRASGHLFDREIRYPDWEPTAATLEHLVTDVGVGGVILLRGSAAEISLRSQQLQTWADIPLLIAADIEEGVGQRFSGATWFPPPLALNAIAQRDRPQQAIYYAEQMGAWTAQEALAIGLNWVLAPVVDVNNNADNPVINVRAFGETPEMVSELAAAYIRSAQSYPVLTAAKHFPGHGDTAVDSHLHLPVLHHSPERLMEIERPPFAAAIAAGVDAVMSAHLLIDCWDKQFPATLSPRILTEELRQGLEFAGLIVTDALVMGAIANRYGPNEAAVLAVEAGADILLMPFDPAGAVEAVCKAVESGRITAHRIRQSLARIWQAKQKVLTSLPTNYNQQPQNLTLQTIDKLAQPAAWATANAILNDSLQTCGTLPWHPVEGQPHHNVIVVDDLLNCNFLDFASPAIALPEQRGFATQLCDCHTTETSILSLESQPTLLQLFIRGNPFRGSAGLTKVAEIWLKHLLKSGQLAALAVYGSPYIWHQFSKQLPERIPGAFSYGQMPEAQAVALGTLLVPSSPSRSKSVFE